MEGGRVVAQGTLQDIVAAFPDMYSEFDRAVKHASESEAELASSGQESDFRKEERLHVHKQVKAAKPKTRGRHKWISKI